MLRFLRIRNLAVVEGVDIEFEPGFTVLTGETGAGKSIVVEAVGLLLGGRASAELVRTGEALATVEALFEAAEGEVTVRREISAQGRSRAFINGELATSAALKALTLHLVELHGQHEHQALLDSATHVPAVDAFAGLAPQVLDLAERWSAYSRAREDVERATLSERERQARLDLIAAQREEIEKARLRPDEDVELAATRTVLAAADRMERLCRQGYEALYDHDASVLAQLAGVWRRVEDLAAIDPVFRPHLEARAGIKAQLEDLAAGLRRYSDGIDASPEHLQQVEERLALAERLKKKYGPSLREVLERGRALAAEQARLSDPSQDAATLTAARDRARARYLEAAREVSRARREAAPRLAAGLATILRQLAMASVRVEMRLREDEPPDAEWGPHGLDSGEFFIAPNPGEDARPLARIVSGGELSRVMLALKTLGADRQPAVGPPRTLVFDEVDAGIGGQVAEVVGQHLESLGARFQVLCVTHLPQIAARATHHLGVAKHSAGARTSVSVERLVEGGSREDELARMIGGTAVTEPLRASARELLGRRADQAKRKEKTKGESESRRPAR